MARLILSLDSQVLAEYNMSKERYTIGRLPDNDVRIDNPAVSGHHSLIINILNDSFLEDLNSTNGTYVNGKLIKNMLCNMAMSSRSVIISCVSPINRPIRPSKTNSKKPWSFLPVSRMLSNWQKQNRQQPWLRPPNPRPPSLRNLPQQPLPA